MKTGDPIVFVVEDDSSMREALTDLITSVGFLVEPFNSAREFLEHRRSDAPACLVLDVRLPGLSGLDLQRELRRLDVHVPTVVITALEDESIAAAAMSLGAVAFLTKPMNNESLMAAINSAVEKRH